MRHIFRYFFSSMILVIFLLAGCGTVKDLTDDNNASKPVAAQYKLSVGIVGNGSVNVSPNLTVFPEGTTVTIVPQPDTGWAFFNSWQGDVTSNFYTILKDSAVTVSFTQLS